VENDLGTLSSSLVALENDLSAGTDPSEDEASVQQASASLQSDAQATQANPPPSCVPGLRQDINAGMTDYSKAAISCNVAVTGTTAGDDQVAASDLYAATSAVNAGTGKVNAATADVQAFSNS